MKLEKGPTATDYSLNPLDVVADGSVQTSIKNALGNYSTTAEVDSKISTSVQTINNAMTKKADKTELANYLKPWIGTQEEYDAISTHDPNTLYMIVEPTTTTTTTTTKAS